MKNENLKTSPTLQLNRVTISHPTYHHFTGCGASDSDLDLLLYGGSEGVLESLINVVCKLKHPLMFSHHDLVVSTCVIPPKPQQNFDDSSNITAPRIPNLRFCTKWSEEGVAMYKQAVATLLPEIRKTWGSPKSSAHISLLLSSTYSAMTLAAQATNDVTKLGDKFQVKAKKINPSVCAAAKHSLETLHNLRSLECCPDSSIAQVEMARHALDSSRKGGRRE